MQIDGGQIQDGLGNAVTATTAATASSADTLIVRNNLTGSNALFTGTLTAVSIVETSALRFKENIIELNSQLNNINQLKPVEFDWKNSQKHDIGFIAEEVDKVYPEVVSKNEAGEVYGISYFKLAAVLVKAIQEQQQQIAELTREVKELKNK